MGNSLGVWTEKEFWSKTYLSTGRSAATGGISRSFLSFSLFAFSFPRRLQMHKTTMMMTSISRTPRPTASPMINAVLMSVSYRIQAYQNGPTFPTETFTSVA